MPENSIPWTELEQLAARLQEPGDGPGQVSDAEWGVIDSSLELLTNSQDWEGIIFLRRLFRPLMARDTIGVMPTFQRLSETAITAAERSGNLRELAEVVAAMGHNLHRQGFHEEAIRAFERAAKVYEEIGEAFQSLKNYYMTSLCHRAMGRRPLARTVLEFVLANVEKDNAWRGNPLQVLAWLAQDDADLAYAETLLKEAMQLQAKATDSDILVAGTLADLGEVTGLLNRTDEAKEYFRQSLELIERHKGQYNRQAARTKLKLAELLMRHGELTRALELLNEADDSIRSYGRYYDLMWRIEMLRSFLFFRLWRWKDAWRKMRMAIGYRRKLALPTGEFVRQLVRRLWLGIGLPR